MLTKKEYKRKSVDLAFLTTCFRCWALTANLGPRLHAGSNVRLPAYCTDCLNYFDRAEAARIILLTQKQQRDLPERAEK
jgi:hypothetical protein